MSDVLQALTFSRKKVVIVETVEDVGKYLSEKDGEETIRINNLVFEKGKKTQWKLRRERIPGIRRRKIRQYINYNNYSYIYIYYDVLYIY